VTLVGSEDSCRNRLHKMLLSFGVLDVASEPVCGQDVAHVECLSFVDRRGGDSLQLGSPYWLGTDSEPVVGKTVARAECLLWVDP